MKKKGLTYIVLVFCCFLSSCSPNAKDAFNDLKQLEGKWKSSGNVIAFENWSLINDSTLTGYKYANKKEEKIILENYRLQRKRDSLWLFILHPELTNRDVKYALYKSRFGEFTFQNPEASYPNKIHIDFIDDSTFVSLKENMRGNKRIEFEMKRWKE